jgi:hypothetical protein
MIVYAVRQVVRMALTQYQASTPGGTPIVVARKRKRVPEKLSPGVFS